MLADCLTENQPLYWVCSSLTGSRTATFLEEEMGVRDENRAAGIWAENALMQQEEVEEEEEAWGKPRKNPIPGSRRACLWRWPILTTTGF